MGQVIDFPALPASYPDLSADLDTAECVLLIAVRWWVESYRNGDDAIPRLWQGLASAGVADAALSIDFLMRVVATTVTRPIDIHCPRCPHVSLDEKHLLRAASHAQADEQLLAERVLRTTLLSAQGAEYAIVPLTGLGELFAQARLFLCRRRLPGEATETGDAPQTRLPRSLH